MANKDISLLILSCDKYACLWNSCIKRIKKYLGIEIDIYLLSNYKENNSVTTIPIGDDIDWSSNLKLALKKINTKYVLLWMDDVYLNEKIQNHIWEKLLSFIQSNNPDFINLKATPLNFYKKQIKGWQLLPKNTLYRVSVVPNIWKVDVLNDLLVKGETAWEFERNGSFRSDKYNNFYISNKAYFNIIHVIYKGKIFRKAYKLLSKSNELEEIINDFSVIGIKENIFVNIRQFIYKVLNYSPINLRACIYNVFKR